MNKNEFNNKLKQAIRTNASRDKTEREAGLMPESELPKHIQLETALMAIKTGLLINDDTCIFEGYAMIQSVLQSMRK